MHLAFSALEAQLDALSNGCGLVHNFKSVSNRTKYHFLAATKRFLIKKKVKRKNICMLPIRCAIGKKSNWENDGNAITHRTFVAFVAAAGSHGCRWAGNQQMARLTTKWLERRKLNCGLSRTHRTVADARFWWLHHSSSGMKWIWDMLRRRACETSQPKELRLNTAMHCIVSSIEPLHAPFTVFNIDITSLLCFSLVISCKLNELGGFQ